MKAYRCKPSWKIGGILGVVVGAGMGYLLFNKYQKSTQPNMIKLDLEKEISTIKKMEYDTEGIVTLESMASIYKLWGQYCSKDCNKLLANHRKARRKLTDNVVKYANCCTEYLMQFDEIVTKKGRELLTKVKLDREVWNKSWESHNKTNPYENYKLGNAITQTIKKMRPTTYDLSIEECKVILSDLIKYWESCQVEEFTQWADKNPRSSILHVLESYFLDKIYEKHGVEEEECLDPEEHTKLDEEANLLWTNYLMIQGEKLNKIKT